MSPHRACLVCQRVMGRGFHHSRIVCDWCSDQYRMFKMCVQQKVKSAIHSGKLPDWRGLRCFVCSDDAIGYHHSDYSEPLNVQPICRSCNWRLGHARMDRVELMPSRKAAA